MTTKAKDLSLSQVKTLHRLRGGIGYRLRTDGKEVKMKCLGRDSDIFG